MTVIKITLYATERSAPRFIFTMRYVNRRLIKIHSAYKQGPVPSCLKECLPDAPQISRPTDVLPWFNATMRAVHKNIGWLVSVLLLLVLGLSATFWTFGQIDQAALERTKAGQDINQAEDFLSALKDAETGQRGYLLTGDATFLQPYAQVLAHVIPDLADLRQTSTLTAAQHHLDAAAPLLQAKMAELAQAIELRSQGQQAAAIRVISHGEGKRLMDAIRLEIGSFVEMAETARAQHDADFQARMRQLFSLIVGIGFVAVLAGLTLAYWVYRAAQQRIENALHLETQKSLARQEASNQLLQTANSTLRENEAKLAVTLNSIGDAVIATDHLGHITLLNPIAQDLTGWTQAQAVGRPVDEVFHIIHKETRHLAVVPVAETLTNGTIQGLANHTVLIARDGREFDIADSCAPIRGLNEEVIGAVLVFRNVTDEYTVQQSLRDSSALLQAILNTVVDGIITVHAHGGIVETVNPAVEHMFGYTTEELSGLRLSQLIPELDQNHRLMSLDYYSASIEAQANGLGREVVGRRKDGSSFALEISVSEMTQGSQRYFTGILRDISARKQAEETLRKAGALQKAIFDSANFSSIATDARGVIQIFNVGAERMLGYTAQEVMNQRTPADISDPQEIIARAKTLSAELDTPITPGFEALVFKASRGIEDIYELTYIRKDGSRFPAVVSVTALRDDNNAIIGYLLIGTDNTARKQIEAERQQLDKALIEKNIELERARDVADKANLAKSDFLSSMSHELRSPLNAILGFAQLMEVGPPEPTPGQKARIEQILRAGWYLLELINEILDLALIESGTVSLSLEPTSLTEVLQDCQTMIEPQAEKRHIHISYPQFEAPCFVQADRTRLKQVIINLLSNAIKYNKADGHVDVTFSTPAAQRLRVTVRDTGEGLSQPKLAQLFQPFNRLGQELNAEEGTGIGLVVSKRLVELMGGAIGAASTVGQGSEFWFELNAADELQLLHDVSEPLAPLHKHTVHNASVRTLLYVEDNRANMELVNQLIAMRPDMNLLGAEDGRRGIEMARLHLPELILMDINLPGISGIQALKLLRQDPATRHIPVMALSANAMPKDIEKGLEAGFFRYLTKPIKIDEFMQALDQGLALANKK